MKKKKTLEIHSKELGHITKKNFFIKNAQNIVFIPFLLSSEIFPFFHVILKGPWKSKEQHTVVLKQGFRILRRHPPVFFSIFHVGLMPVPGH